LPPYDPHFDLAKIQHEAELHNLIQHESPEHATQRRALQHDKEQNHTTPQPANTTTHDIINAPHEAIQLESVTHVPTPVALGQSSAGTA